MRVFVTNKDVFVLRYYSSSDDPQFRYNRLIQQINRLLESFILYKCCICLLGCFDRSMAKQMLNVSNGSTSTQQACGKRLSQIVRGDVCSAGSSKSGFLCPIVLSGFVSTETTRKNIVTADSVLPIEKRRYEDDWPPWQAVGEVPGSRGIRARLRNSPSRVERTGRTIVLMT